MISVSQDNLTWTAQRAHEVYDWKFDEEQIVSYLPLSHVAGTFIDIYLTMWGGGTVHFAAKMALQGPLPYIGDSPRIGLFQRNYIFK